MILNADFDWFVPLSQIALELAEPVQSRWGSFH